MICRFHFLLLDVARSIAERHYFGPKTYNVLPPPAVLNDIKPIVVMLKKNPRGQSTWPKQRKGYTSVGKNVRLNSI